MSDELVKRLRELALAATPGPWMLATGCSWRRILTSAGERVCEPTVHSRDGHPDLLLSGPDGMHRNGEYIAAVDPQTVLGLLAALTAQAQTIERLTEQLAASRIECHMNAAKVLSRQSELEVLHREYDRIEAELREAAK